MRKTFPKILILQSPFITPNSPHERLQENQPQRERNHLH